MKSYNLFIFFVVIFIGYTKAQKQKDSIKIQVVDVVKPYNPEVSDAFKIRDYPKIPTYQKTKKPYTYNIKPVLFSEVFQPKSGNFRHFYLKKHETIRQKNNYLYFGYGNANTPFLQTFLNKKYKKHYFKFTFNHLSSDANVKDALVKNLYQNTDAILYYHLNGNKQKWKANLSYGRKKRYWYGIDTSFSKDISNFDFEQMYQDITCFISTQVKKSLLKKTDVTYSVFSDKFQSSEQYLKMNTFLELPYNSSQVFTNVLLEYLSTNFEQKLKKYRYLTIGTDINYPLQEGDFYLSIGINFRYNRDLMDNEKSKFHLYPNIKINYKFLAEIINAYAGFQGNLYTQSYKKFTLKNPFIAPELNIKPTNRNFDFYLGVKGKLTDKTTYNVTGSYILEKNSPFFKNYSVSSIAKPYHLSNSFVVLYDDITKISFLAQLQTEIIENLNVRTKISYDYYDAKNQPKVWNLPNLSGSILMNYHKDKWSAGFTTFFVGGRKDLQKEQIVTLPIFIDVGCLAMYHLNSGIDFSLSVDNLFNTYYQRYLRYNVQGLQLLLGIKFRFGGGGNF